ncbi:two-component response regulator ORR29-like [Phragmites australis]|uniref:two-component response regulator ORR29-like n=1 Tax=Phragmites australis TaxID=29695 RepID=UPI002D77D998|nr:two-component response regulator ORR29-like [Phragmites australis]
MLDKLDFHVMVYTSPIKALKFLEDHEDEVDFLLVEVQMKEMHGFQFLDISRDVHKKLQVIMMSTETTFPKMQRCIELGARFLVKKPLDTNTINNLWQHLDLKFPRMEKIKDLFKGIEEGKAHDVNCSSKEELEKIVNKCGKGTKQKTVHLMWTPFLQSKFLQALELLGEDATPKKIEMIMNVNSIDRKQISAHLQKHRKRMEKELRNALGAKKCSEGGASSSSEPAVVKTCEIGPNCNHNIQSADRNDEEKSHDQTETLAEEMQGNKVYVAMQKALQLGTVFDELQLSNDPSGDEAKKGEEDMMGDGDARDDGTTFEVGEAKVVSKIQDFDDAKEVTNRGDSDTVSGSVDQAGVVNLVNYSDSEDDEDNA